MELICNISRKKVFLCRSITIIKISITFQKLLKLKNFSDYLIFRADIIMIHIYSKAINKNI